MPAKWGSRDDLGLALTFLRWLKDWKQEDLVAASGVSLACVQSLEQGRRRFPTLKTLAPIAAALGVDLGTIEAMVGLIHRLRDGEMGGGHSAGSVHDGATAPMAGERISGPPAATLPALSSFLRQALDCRPPASREMSREDAKAHAAALWSVVERCQEDLVEHLVRELPAFQTTELCELICERSIDAAVDSAEEAARLADLAMEIAARVPGSEGLRSRLTGYAGVHRANALRVAGADLPGADEAFARALTLWSAGASDDPGLLNEARVLGLEASLRRAQRRLPEAMALLDQALVLDRWGEAPALLLAKARTLFQLGELAASIEVLRQAAPQVDGGRKPRQRLTLSDLLALNLCHLGRYAEAELLLPELRALAIELGNRLDLLRVDWLAGRVDAGQGRADEAIVGLARVREAFRAQGNAYVVALLTVELAEVHAAVGRTAQVKALAREAAPLLEEQGVHAEARRALALFCRAAEEERLTGALLRALVVYLDRARHDPGLHFEAAP